MYIYINSLYIYIVTVHYIVSDLNGEPQELMVGPLVPHWTPVVSCQADAGAALLRAVFAQDPTPIRDAEL